MVGILPQKWRALEPHCAETHAAAIPRRTHKRGTLCANWWNIINHDQSNPRRKLGFRCAACRSGLRQALEPLPQKANDVRPSRMAYFVSSAMLWMLSFSKM